MSDEPEDLSVLAGEYAVGLLDAAEALEVRRRAAREPALAAAIAEWEVRLAPLARLVEPIAPPAALWDRIEASVRPLPANDLGLPRKGGVWRSPAFWRGTTVLGLALAAAFAAVAFLPQDALPPQFRLQESRRSQPLVAAAVPAPPMPAAVATLPPEQVAAAQPSPAPAPRAPAEVQRVAAIASLKGPGVLFLAEARPDGTINVIALSSVPVPANRDLELWLLPRGATRPSSLGVLPARGRTVERSQEVPAGAQLLISLEPRGGSRTGLPTGPVLYGGTVIGL